MIRTGSDYIASLTDGRTVYIDGTEVNDVIDHPAFRNAIRSYAAMYDFQAAPENVELMTFEVRRGRRVNRAWQLPNKLSGTGPAAPRYRGLGRRSIAAGSAARPTISPPAWAG